ncbi:lysine decarboxylase, partial [Pseudomonas zeae]
PQYSIIASCDVAAAMMEPPAGTALVEESIRESLDFRRAMRKVEGDYGDDWWFKVWGPDFLRAQDDQGSEPVSADWMLHADEDWHGFGGLA